jgi:hypothetical protein
LADNYIKDLFLNSIVHSMVSITGKGGKGVGFSKDKRFM